MSTHELSAPLSSISDGYRAVVFGASGGLGGALARTLIDDPRCQAVHVGSRKPSTCYGSKCRPFSFDLEDEASITAAVQTILGEGLPDLVLVATGVLHSGSRLRPEKSWRALDAASLHYAFSINAVGPALIAKQVLPHLGKAGKSVFAVLSARVGSISDNQLGGWHAYRASKAALNMLVRNLAIELKRTRPLAVCVALHPGTVDTALSQPFQSRVQSARLLTPEASARHLLSVIDTLTPGQSGRVFAWDGEEIMG